MENVLFGANLSDWNRGRAKLKNWHDRCTVKRALAGEVPPDAARRTVTVRKDMTVESRGTGFYFNRRRGGAV